MKRARSILGMAGLIGCGLMTLMIVLSCWWRVDYESGALKIAIGVGKVMLGYPVPPRPFGCRVGGRTMFGSTWRLVFSLPTFTQIPMRAGSTSKIANLLSIPLWIPLLITAIPSIWLRRRHDRHPPGHCQRCGYDLTGNESGVCPECGTDVPGD